MPTSEAALAPRPAIYVDGIEQAALCADVVRLVIEEALASPARCTAHFANLKPSSGGPEFKDVGLQEVTFGRTLTVWQGVPPATLVRMFEGRV